MPVFATCPKVAANPDAGREDPHKMMQRLIGSWLSDSYSWKINKNQSPKNLNACDQQISKLTKRERPILRMFGRVFPSFLLDQFQGQHSLLWMNSRWRINWRLNGQRDKFLQTAVKYKCFFSVKEKPKKAKRKAVEEEEEEEEDAEVGNQLVVSNKFPKKK